MRWILPLLLCCAIAIMASSTSLASGPVSLNEDVGPTYVRFHTAYEGVGKYGGRFPKGEIAKVTKKIDAYYFEASTDLDSNYGQKARWDKVDVITREQALLQLQQEYDLLKEEERASERRRMASVVLDSGLVSDLHELRAFSDGQLVKAYEIAKDLLHERRQAVAISQPRPERRQYIYERDSFGNVNPVPVGAVRNGQVHGADRFGNISPQPAGVVRRNHIYDANPSRGINPLPSGFVDPAGRVFDKSGETPFIIR